MSLLAIPALLGTYFGFASALGELIFRARTNFPDRYLIGAVLFAGGIFLPASLALPLPAWLRLLMGAAGLALVAAFGLRPRRLPHWLWSPTFAYRYLIGLMVVISLWSVSQGSSPPILGLGFLAALAAGLATVKGRALRPPREAASAPQPNAG